jgi:hypothetical protein
VDLFGVMIDYKDMNLVLQQSFHMLDDHLVHCLFHSLSRDFAKTGNPWMIIGDHGTRFFFFDPQVVTGILNNTISLKSWIQDLITLIVSNNCVVGLPVHQDKIHWYLFVVRCIDCEVSFEIRDSMEDTRPDHYNQTRVRVVDWISKTILAVFFKNQRESVLKFQKGYTQITVPKQKEIECGIEVANNFRTVLVEGGCRVDKDEAWSRKSLLEFLRQHKDVRVQNAMLKLSGAGTGGKGGKGERAGEDLAVEVEGQGEGGGDKKRLGSSSTGDEKRAKAQKVMGSEEQGG